MSDYTAAPATKMLATNCVVCGRPLVDARSVEMGIGPECRESAKGGIDDGTRQVANEYVYDAAIAAQEGRIEDVMRHAQTIEDMGLKGLADKIRRRFRKASEREADITIEVEGAYYKVKTPFRRGDKEAFIAAWRRIPGRRYRNRLNYIPVAQKTVLWALLREFFGGKYGRGPKGLFRIPKPEPKPEQMTFEQRAEAAGQNPGNLAEYEMAQREMAQA